MLSPVSATWTTGFVAGEDVQEKVNVHFTSFIIIGYTLGRNVYSTVKRLSWLNMASEFHKNISPNRHMLDCDQ